MYSTRLGLRPPVCGEFVEWDQFGIWGLGKLGSASGCFSVVKEERSQTSGAAAFRIRWASEMAALGIPKVDTSSRMANVSINSAAEVVSFSSDPPLGYPYIRSRPYNQLHNPCRRLRKSRPQPPSPLLENVWRSQV